MTNRCCQTCCLHCGLHPPLLFREYVKWDELKTDLNSALARKKSKQRNAAVSALLLSWVANDLIDVPQEKEDLANVFTESYGAVVTKWDIPSENAGLLLHREVLDFLVHHDREDSLLIIYYGGHGDVVDEECHWVATPNNDMARLNWSSIQQSVIRDTKADLLILLDCCYAGAAARGLVRGRKELLAACGKDFPATGQSTSAAPTFSRALIDQLNAHVANESPLTISELHARLSKLNLQHSPYYCTLAGWSRSPIVLFPVSYNPNDLVHHSRNESILIHIHLSGTPPSEAWEEWLTTGLPDGVAAIEIGAIYKSNSNILLLSVPLELWGFLPENAAYSFIGSVKSGNILLNRKEHGRMASGVQSGSGIIEEIDQHEYKKKCRVSEDEYGREPRESDSSLPAPVDDAKATHEDSIGISQGPVTVSDVEDIPQSSLETKEATTSETALKAMLGNAPVEDVPWVAENTSLLKSKDKSGQTALHQAVKTKDIALVLKLLGGSDDLDAPDDIGRTALHRAVESGFEPVVQLLLDKGANIHASDNLGQTALHRAASGGFELIVELLLEKGIAVDTLDNLGRSALYHAAAGGHDVVAQLLLQRGVDPNARDDLGQTGLHRAAAAGHGRVVKLLLEIDAVDIAIQDNLGRTALHRAVSGGHEDTVLLLLEYGIDPGVQNNSGRTAMDTARLSKLWRIADRLRAASV